MLREKSTYTLFQNIWMIFGKDEASIGETIELKKVSRKVPILILLRLDNAILKWI